VSSLILQDQMDAQLRRTISVHRILRLPKVNGSMRSQRLSNGLAGLHAERPGPRRDHGAPMVIGAHGGFTWTEWEQRPGVFHRLHRRLRVNAENDRVFGRGPIETDPVEHPVDRRRVRRYLDELGPPRLQPRGSLDAADGHGLLPTCLGYTSGDQSRGLARPGFECPHNDGLDLVVGRGSPRPQSGPAMEYARVAPGRAQQGPTHLALRVVQGIGYCLAEQPTGTSRDDARAARYECCCSATVSQRMQSLPFVVGYDQTNLESAGSHRSSASGQFDCSAVCLSSACVAQRGGALPPARPITRRWTGAVTFAQEHQLRLSRILIEMSSRRRAGELQLMTGHCRLLPPGAARSVGLGKRLLSDPQVERALSCEHSHFRTPETTERPERAISRGARQ
jgi:hypothetical protein